MTDQRGRAFGFVNFEQSKDAKECLGQLISPSQGLYHPLKRLGLYAKHRAPIQVCANDALQRPSKPQGAEGGAWLQILIESRALRPRSWRPKARPRP